MQRVGGRRQVGAEGGVVGVQQVVAGHPLQHRPQSGRETGRKLGRTARPGVLGEGDAAVPAHRPRLAVGGAAGAGQQHLGLHALVGQGVRQGQDLGLRLLVGPEHQVQHACGRHHASTRAEAVSASSEE